jgi:hypothetical protein
VADRDLGGGWRLVVVDPTQESTVALLLYGTTAYDMLALRSIGGAEVGVQCSPVSGVTTCLIDGVPGAHTAFGAVVQVAGGRIRALNTDLAAEGGFEITGRTADSMLIAGPVSSFSYGLSYAASPQAWRTYLIRGGTLRSGCSAPAFVATAAPRTPQTGPCTGTPAIAGWGPESAKKLRDLTQGAVSESGNIHCALVSYTTDLLACTIGATDFDVPKDCPGQPGTIVSWPVGGKPTLSGCAGDTMVMAGRAVLPYDTLAVGAGFGCVIRQSGGVKCQDATGHGFTLARAGYTTF